MIRFRVLVPFLLGVGVTVSICGGVASASEPYQVDHEFTIELSPRWSFDPMQVGFAVQEQGIDLSLDVAEIQWSFFRARALSAWYSPAHGQAVRGVSFAPVGLTLPPYRARRVRPYYLFHWSMLGHEIGLEAGPNEAAGVGLRVAGVYAQDFSALTVAASFGSEADFSDSSFYDYDGFRFGLGGVGASVGSGTPVGVRGSFLDFQLNAFLASVVEYDFEPEGTDVYLLSILPIGLALPPGADSWFMPYYKFHWNSIVAQVQEGTGDSGKLIGQHSLGLGIVVPEDAALAPLLKVSVTTGSDIFGRTSTRFSAEVETAYVLALFIR